MRRPSMPRVLSLALTLGLLVVTILLLQAVQGDELSILAAAPELTITKTDWPDPVRSGGPLTYTLVISYTSNPNDSITNVVVTDTLDANSTLVFSETTSADLTCSLTDVSVVVCKMLEMTANSQQAITLIVTVTEDFTGTLTNVVTVDSDETDPSSDTEVTDVWAVADLWITKAATPAPVVAGAALTYTLVVTNDGFMTATGIVLTDTLPGEVVYGSSPTHGTDCSQSSGVVTCTLDSIAAGLSQTVELLVSVTSGATGPLVNWAEVSGNVIDENTGNNRTADVETPVIAQANLVITKSDFPNPVAAGSALTYTVVITNQGPSDATGIWLTDTLPVSVTFDSATPVQTSGPDPLVWELGDLSEGLSKTVTVVVTPFYWISTALTNEVQVRSDTFDPITETGNTYSVTTPVVLEADLQVGKSARPDQEVVAGTALTYTVIVTNGGPSTATGVVLTETLPSGLALKSFVTSTGGYTPETGIWSVGDMAPDSSATLTLVTLVDPSSRGELVNHVEAGSEVQDPDLSSNVATETTTVEAEADLEVVKRDFPDPVAAGTTLTYTVVITNHGPSDATGIELTDTLPLSVTFGSATPAQTSGPDPLVWELGALGRGLSKTVTVIVTPDPWISTTLTNTVTVTATEDDPEYPNQYEEETVVKPLCELIQVTATTADVVNAWPSIGGLGAETRIAYLSDRTGWEELFVATLTDPVQTQQATISADGTTHEPPAISGDGRRVAFVSDGDYDPWMANADGSAEVFVYGTRFGGFENITGNAGSVFPGFVLPASPDDSGGRLTFAADYDYSGGNPDANLEIWLYDSADGPFRQVDGGGSHTCGLRADGRVACWGYDAYHQALAPAGPFLQISAGGYHTCALRDTGSLLCWGANWDDQVSPLPAGTFAQVSAGGYHTCGLLESGAVGCWGYNYYGQAPGARTGPYRQVSAGGYHTCGLLESGAVECWGRWYEGQTSVPSVSGPWVQVSAGDYHTCGLLESGAVECWGYNYWGQAPASRTGPYRQVSAGGYHTCGLLESGAVECWGADWNDQVSSVPDDSGPFSWIGAGDYHTCGVEIDGGLACWGADWYDQTSPPSGGRQMLQITDSTQGSSSHVATSGNGQVVAFLSDADLVPGENDDESVELYVARMDLDDPQIAQVTHTTSDVSISHPSISYDGSRIAFLSDGNLVPTTGNSDGTPEVFMAKLDPDNLSGTITLIQITHTGSDITNAEPALSGDGKTIAFVSDDELDQERDNADGNPELYLATVDSPGTFIQVTLSESTVTNAAPSINHLGTQVAFVSDGNLRLSPGNPQGNQEVFVASCHLPLPGTYLEVVKDGPISTWYGGTYPYTLTVTNIGQMPAFGVIVVDQLDGSATLYPGDPRCVEQGQDEVTCYASELDAGETMTLTVWARVEGETGTLTNRVDAWAVNAPVPVTATLPIQIGPAADLSVVKSTLARWVRPGETITYTILINNLDGLATSFTVTDTVVTHLSYVTGTAELTDGSCGWQGDSLICTSLSELAVRDTAILTLAITPQLAGVITNTVRVKGGYPDPLPANNEASVVLGPPMIYLPLILRVR